MKKQNRPEVVKAAQEKMRTRNRKIVEDELKARGGHCTYPGCRSAKVEWHHRDRSTKSKDIAASVWNDSERRLRAELALCDPLCHQHHRLTDGRGKLTDARVREIRRRLQTTEMKKDIAKAFGVSPSTITHIAKGKTWRSV